GIHVSCMTAFRVERPRFCPAPQTVANRGGRLRSHLSRSKVAMTQSRFTGKTALVTGGGAGLGRATALAFAREGPNGVIGNRNVERGKETVELIAKAGGTAVFRRTDVTAAADTAALVALAVERFGRLDCAFNNAGVMTGLSLIEEQSEADYD